MINKNCEHVSTLSNILIHQIPGYQYRNVRFLAACNGED